MIPVKEVEVLSPSSPWHPLAVSSLADELAPFEEWVLCGGYSVDWYLGKTSRDHGDVDVGVFRSQLDTLLAVFDRNRVYLCDPPGSLQRWDGRAVPDRVHDIWVADQSCSHWVLQIMVFDDTDESVIYRRNPDLRWPKTAHSIEIDGLRILNPLVTFLYKSHKPRWEPKDILDLAHLIEKAGHP